MAGKTMLPAIYRPKKKKRNKNPKSKDHTLCIRQEPRTCAWTLATMSRSGLMRLLLHSVFPIPHFQGLGTWKLVDLEIGA
jgi:hypothetical protein